MKYQHHFQVCAPLATVAGFYAQSTSMGAITPPPIAVTVHRAPVRLANGDEMDFTLWLGPLPVHWIAQIEDAGPAGFTDRQVRGPFGKWIHCHRFVVVDESVTEVLDEIELNLRPHLVWGLVGLGMWLSLPLLFAYRSWKTRRLLEARR
jgi:ligand-binding SRPBCC domain-containing protein